MDNNLRPVETIEAVLESVRRFNEGAGANPERTQSVLRTTSYWVYDATTSQFGPGKFAGFEDMTFDLYELGHAGETTGAKFDGHISRTAIEEVAGSSFEANPALHPELSEWGKELLGDEAFGGADPSKWKFVVIEGSSEAEADESDNLAVGSDGKAEQPQKRRNPPWQRDELILALDLYVRHGGKHLSESHEDIVELSEVLNRLPIHPGQASDTFRNPNGVSMKLVNFRRFDPKQSGVGLTRGNRLEKEVWGEFALRPEVLAKIAEIIREGYTHVEEGSESDDEEAFPEGRVIFRLHRLRERNKGVIDKAKAKVLKRDGKLACCVCLFDFAAVYGVLGEGYIEGHHTTALSDLKGETETKASQIALVCSNCHRMLHRRRPWLPVEELASILKK